MLLELKEKEKDDVNSWHSENEVASWTRKIQKLLDENANLKEEELKRLIHKLEETSKERNISIIEELWASWKMRKKLYI